MASLVDNNPLPVVDPKHKELLEAVFNHKSLAPVPVATLDGEEDLGETIMDNERLAYLGDQILHMCVTDVLFMRFPADKVGELNHKRELCVKKKQIAKWSNLYGLPPQIRAPTHQQAAIQSSTIQQAFVLQAYLAVVFLTSDYTTVRIWVKSLIAADLDNILEAEREELARTMAGMNLGDGSGRAGGTSPGSPPPPSTPPRSPPAMPASPTSPSNKTALATLNEMCTQLGCPMPEWTTTESGQPHERTFTMRLRIVGRGITAQGTAKNKKEAQQIAAAIAVQKLLE